jgi:PTH1 family peptidyl-tRNA hydrolase
MWLFAGLGNIGREYAGTRHNVGFDVVDRVERVLTRSTGWRAGKGDYYVAKGSHSGQDVLLIKPTTYMNLSGRAIRDALSFYKSEISELVVVVDEIAIPLGQLRLRLKGSDGGHNGLTSSFTSLAPRTSQDYVAASVEIFGRASRCSMCCRSSSPTKRRQPKR